MTTPPPQTARRQVWYDPEDPRSPKEQHEQYVRDAEVSLPQLLTTTPARLDEREQVWAKWREFTFSLVVWNRDDFNPRYGVHVEAIADEPLDAAGHTAYLSHTQYFAFPGDAIDHLNEFVDWMLTFGMMFNYDRRAVHMHAVIKGSNTPAHEVT
jgi:hypothetical protein